MFDIWRNLKWLYTSSGEAVFFSRQEQEPYLWIMLPMIVTNEVPQRAAWVFVPCLADSGVLPAACV